jgi:hypothetical protein
MTSPPHTQFGQLHLLPGMCHTMQVIELVQAARDVVTFWLPWAFVGDTGPFITSSVREVLMYSMSSGRIATAACASG